MAVKGRGSGTHGHGSSKKNRGAGNRGGRGKAGRGKKAKHKKISGMRDDVLGEGGFKRPQSVVDQDETINLKQIDQKIDDFVEKGFAEKEGDKYVLNVKEAGYDKVLGSGRLYNNIDVKSEKFSESAKKKITENGNKAVELD